MFNFKSKEMKKLYVLVLSVFLLTVTSNAQTLTKLGIRFSEDTSLKLNSVVGFDPAKTYYEVILPVTQMVVPKVEATPAESTTYRLAKHDKEKYPNIITAAKDGNTPYYTNSSHLPVGFTDDIFTALDIEDELQTLYTSGTVFHAFLGEKLPSWQSAMTLVRKIATNYHLPYYTISPTYSICSNHGYLSGEVYTCPICGQKTEVWSRITGYYRPIQNWNDGKAEEFKERKEYKLDNNILKGLVDFKQEIKKPIQTNMDSDLLLFTTSTCPNCKVVKNILDTKNINYKIIEAEKNIDLVDKYNISKAPTIIIGGNKYQGIDEIKSYLEALK